MPVVSQTSVKRLLRRQLLEGRVPHALLFTGGEGRGKLAMAWQYAGSLLCENRTAEGKPCGVCPSCRMSLKLAHPDMFFIFPVVKPAGQQAAVSDRYLREWRELMGRTPYFTPRQWLEAMGTENQQAQIGVAEAEDIARKLSVTTWRGGYRPVIVWQAELMNVQAANKLLKLLEEPPAGTVFMLISAHPERMLDTIRSRTQVVEFAPLPEDDIAVALQKDCGIGADDARLLARTAEGSYTRALLQVGTESDAAQYLDLFIMLMRLAYQRKLRELYDWAETMAKKGREQQKAFLGYSLRLVRENFVYNFRRAELNALSQEEGEFSSRFARFINERNVIPLAEELSDALRDIEQNTNGRMVMFDLALKVIMLLKH